MFNSGRFEGIMFNSGRMSGAGNIQDVAYLRNQNCLVTASLNFSSKVMNGHKNSNDIHNYHDHDEIKLC